MLRLLDVGENTEQVASQCSTDLVLSAKRSQLSPVLGSVKQILTTAGGRQQNLGKRVTLSFI